MGRHDSGLLGGGHDVILRVTGVADDPAAVGGSVSRHPIGAIMTSLRPYLVAVVVLVPLACARGPAGPPAATVHSSAAKLARVYYWRAKPGKFDEYTRYVREHAEPIDADAHRRGAFLSVTTYMTRDTLSPWTHMRVFELRDSAQLEGLSGALSAAGIRLEPDSVKRRQTREYSAGLRDAVGSATATILR
jgi:hypothetical protein